VFIFVNICLYLCVFADICLKFVDLVDICENLYVLYIYPYLYVFVNICWYLVESLIGIPRAKES
jgi:hypothetical protein